MCNNTLLNFDLCIRQLLIHLGDEGDLIIANYLKQLLLFFLLVAENCFLFLHHFYYLTAVRSKGLIFIYFFFSQVVYSETSVKRPRIRP